PAVTADLFIEPLPRIPRLILFGAGHVGAEIARAAAATDFHVVVVDDREEFANRDRFPTAAEVIVRDLPGALAALTLDGDDYVIACTRGHAMDALVVERTAASAARYVGMLGSRRKREVIWKALETAGVPRAALERVKVPIGEDIGADTPGEIGIAVMAELIRLRRLGA
ncbi:MAG: XdhC family protein, partial [Gemmatimonadota bacterium]|nr:XdhC family protein [Gemmatimonadota bacterium]